MAMFLLWVFSLRINEYGGVFFDSFPEITIFF